MLAEHLGGAVASRAGSAHELQSREGGQEFDRVVLLSHDQKVDWSRAGLSHPILVAEIHALLGVPFEIWALDKLAAEILANT